MLELEFNNETQSITESSIIKADQLPCRINGVFGSFGVASNFDICSKGLNRWFISEASLNELITALKIVRNSKP